MMFEHFRKIHLVLLLLPLTLCLPADDGKNQPPPPPPAFHPGPPGFGNPRGAFFAKLTKEEREQVNRLAQEGKKEELRKMMRSLRLKYRSEEMKKLDELSERYLAAKDAGEKAAIRKEMEPLIRTIFQKRQTFTRNNIMLAEKQLARTRQDLERLKRHYERSEKDAEKIIADQVEQMCLPKSQRRKPPRRPPPVQEKK